MSTRRVFLRALKPPHSTTGQGLLCYISVFQELPSSVSPWLIFSKSHARYFSHFRAVASHKFSGRVPEGIVPPAQMGPYAFPFGQTPCECPAIWVFEFRIPILTEHNFKKLLFSSFQTRQSRYTSREQRDRMMTSALTACQAPWSYTRVLRVVNDHYSRTLHVSLPVYTR